MSLDKLSPVSQQQIQPASGQQRTPLDTNTHHGPAVTIQRQERSHRPEVASDLKLEVGSLVQMPASNPNKPPLYGVIRWIGTVPGIAGPVAGIELVRKIPTIISR